MAALQLQFTSINPVAVDDARLKFMFNRFASTGDIYFIANVSLRPE
jgi:hypothetical protein